MMSLVRRFVHGVSSLIRRNREEQELNDEVREYLEMAAERKMAAGSSPEEARRAARIELGSVAAIKDEVRNVGWESKLETLAQDVRFAVRTLWKFPGFTAVAVITLALGIGSTTAIFTVVNAVLWTPLAYPNAARLVRIVENVPAEESITGRAMRLPSMNPAEVTWWRQNARSLENIAVMMPDARTFMTRDGTVLLNGQRVSAALFPMRSVKPVLGRGLYSDEERPDAQVVVLGASTWQRYFESDPNVVNRTVVLDGQTYTIVGVMPPEFGEQAYWLPYVIEPPRTGAVQLVQVTCLLKQGISLASASAEVNALGRQLRGSIDAEPANPPRFEVTGEQDQMVAMVRPALRTLVVAVCVVLLIVCANIANLVLVRGAGRHREIGIRRALGASRGRVIRQLLTEGFVLSLAGGVLGTAMAYAGVSVLKAISVIDVPARYRNALGPLGTTILPRADEVAVDPHALAFAFGISVLTGVLFGVAPALRLSRADHRETIAGADLTTRTGPARGRNHVGQVLATAQIGLATTLLIASGLLLHSFLNLSTLFLGFDPNTQIFQLVNPREYSRSRKLEIAYSLSRQLKGLPGVESAGFINMPPLSPNGIRQNLYLPSEWESQRETLGDEYRASILSMSPGYLQATGVRLLEGRWLDERDTSGSARAMLVNRAWTERFSPQKSPIGTTVTFVTTGRIRRPLAWDVVGVVENVRARVDGGSQSGQTSTDLPLLVYTDLRQYLTVASGDRGIDGVGMELDMMMGEPGGLSFAIRARDPLTLSSLREVARQADAQIAIEGVTTMGEVFSGLIGRQRFYALVVGVFAAIAGFIASIGIYGVLAYAMTQRTSEFGIRLALGARPREVLGLVLGQGLVLVLCGILAGVAGAIALTRYLSTMLFGLTPLDPLTYAVVGVLFATVALAASYIPARRATKVDPAVALRSE
jgi:predicted permease